TAVATSLRFFGYSKVDGPWCRPSGFGSNPDIKSVCSPSAGGPTFDGGALGVGGTTPETPPLEAPGAGQCELGFWSLNPSGGPPSAGSASLPQDPGKGMNQGY